MKQATGIRFGDNDFVNTLLPFFQHIVANLDFEPTKEQLVKIFNESSYGFYLAFQNCFNYENEGTKDYLEIDVSRVYIGDEVTKYVTEETNFHNHDFVYVMHGGVYVA